MPEDPIDRYARGDLPAGEARDLALKSLDDPELFDELTAVALAKAAVTPPERRRRNPGIWIGIAAGIAVVAAGALKLARSPAPAAPRPALASILLAEGLRPQDSIVFRGAEPAGRDPRPSGRIVSLEGAIASLDLGSLDGLTQGSELDTARGARLIAGAVFRERAEARVAGTGTVRAGDEVRVPAGARLRALLDQVDARYARGELPAALAAAQEAAQFAAGANLPQRPAAWNRLAVLLMLSGDYQAAGLPLRQAVAILPRSDPAYARCANNLAVLAEVGGDRRRAAELYAAALAAAPSPEAERRVIESNLTRVRGSP